MTSATSAMRRYGWARPEVPDPRRSAWSILQLLRQPSGRLTMLGVQVLQVLLVDLDVKLPIVAHHHRQHLLDDSHLLDELIDVRLVEQLERLCAALFLLALAMGTHDTTHGIALKYRVPTLIMFFQLWPE
eukprot:CAMPEP_0180714444 /NCGR_PEP_ID=MMETSP1038_2-20121128/12425_1 /TAXON_ID=632150 /ORGANISM="Azadinium spinosum, Strain 3D9" /LENGTH=129 /DNA_ID=CAMNT_0022746809 /DNA_START=72 /DNA_END=461 /DNA_ORIENTATION=-